MTLSVAEYLGPWRIVVHLVTLAQATAPGTNPRRRARFMRRRVGLGCVGGSRAEVLELNLMTAIRTTRAALPHLIEGGGVVVNVSSVNGHLPSTSIYAYSAGKAAMDNLTVGLSHEFARQRVRVVGVAPGPVSTPLWLGPTGVAATVAARTGSDPQTVVDQTIAEIPIGRFTTPEEVGDLVAFLASARAGTITGTTIRIDGGITPSV